ncbi:uncharacterized protein YALI1_B01127g [Yarrowia lipolytica]|uniref:Uncharacterized protein n=1 Tax=Yarrowia lipolytica TaxID=4952 RepID=A0A1D8N5V8_YARLL|nr:hypothetical protein YALI1_B01127g [Yarrowia lipolytica]
MDLSQETPEAPIQTLWLIGDRGCNVGLLSHCECKRLGRRLEGDLKTVETLKTSKTQQKEIFQLPCVQQSQISRSHHSRLLYSPHLNSSPVITSG